MLERASDLSRRSGARLVFVYLPSWTRFHGFLFKDRRPEILRVASDLDLPIVDVAGVLERDSDRDRFFPFRRGGHFNSEGYALLARIIEEAALGVTGGETPRTDH